MAIKNRGGLTDQEVMQGIQNGGKFVVFKYAISIVILSFNPNSDIHYIRPGESTFKFSIGYSIMTFFLGWWGFPWGPIYTIGALYQNFNGGKNVTNEVMAQSNINIAPASNAPSSGPSAYNVPNNQSNNPGTYNVPSNNSSNQGSSPYNIR